MKKINVSQSIGLLANVGVIAGIVFLAVEIQQNNKLLQAEAIASAFEGRISRNQEIFRDESLAELSIRARSGELSGVDLERINAFYSTTLLNWQRDYYLFQESIMSEEQLRANLPVMKLAYRPRDGGQSPRDLWDIGGSTYATAEFSAFMEQCVFSDCASIPR